MYVSCVRSILDLPRTLQVLETNGVYVATVGSDAEFPAFFSRRSARHVLLLVQCPFLYGCPISSRRAT